MLSLNRELVMPYACAIEMIHTYSLIHDDLPCMDNDTIRRGQPTCHVQFSEATALLAGDALLNGAYEILFDQCADGNRSHCKAGAYLAESAGMNGMIGGQSDDIAFDLQSITPDRLYALHRKKTGALIRASVMVPWILAGPSVSRADTGVLMDSYATHLGLSFQIKDDLLDVSSTYDKLGKTVGKDEKSGKATFVTVFGLAEAERLFREEISAANRALDDLRNLGYNTDLIAEFTNDLSEREK